MATHFFTTAAGAKATSGTGGGGSTIQGTTLIDSIREPDDNGGSGQTGVSVGQIATGVTNAAAQTDFQMVWKVSGTAGLRIELFDDSSASSSGGGASDNCLAYKPASQGGGTVDFRDMTGVVDAEQYNRSLSTYTYGAKTVNFVDGEGFNDTYKADIFWNSVNVGGGTGINGAGTAWSPGDTHLNAPYTYTIGAFQETYNGDLYYEVGRERRPLTAYSFNATTGNITGLRVEGSITNNTTSGSGYTTPLRTLHASNIDAVASCDSGWVTSGLTNGITLSVIQPLGTINSAGTQRSATFQGELNLWARSVGVSDTIMKTVKFTVQTTATTV